MYCGGLPQNTAPVELVQSLLQLPVSTLVVQLTWQSRFACTSHEPLQLAWHCVVQSAVGGTASHWTPQRLVQSAMQSVGQLALWALHALVQLDWQSSVHAPAQAKLPGSALHVVMQDALHVPVQAAVGCMAAHWPSQSATKLGAVH
jgi:hypothetical protein